MNQISLLKNYQKHLKFFKLMPQGLQSKVISASAVVLLFRKVAEACQLNA